mmetsp:Transcript_24069/g.39184  ORF Transcript_24069/g.39184 Transcript_24069/m.39184 type:complete len:91 (-) Transcript_24069:55-327(-)
MCATTVAAKTSMRLLTRDQQISVYLLELIIHSNKGETKRSNEAPLLFGKVMHVVTLQIALLIYSHHVPRREKYNVQPLLSKDIGSLVINE